MAGRRRELNNTPAILLIIGLRLKDSRDYLFYRIQPQKGEGIKINKNEANGKVNLQVQCSLVSHVLAKLINQIIFG